MISRNDNVDAENFIFPRSIDNYWVFY